MLITVDAFMSDMRPPVLAFDKIDKYKLKLTEGGDLKCDIFWDAPLPPAVSVNVGYVECYYCTISNDSSPLGDCDTPDEIFVSSPHQRACDRAKFSLGVVISQPNPNITA
jgi:hypothetical protein